MERTIICPECGTEQRADSPFCESCGYRLRSQETQLEGLPAISPEMLMRSAHDPTRPDQVTTAPEPIPAVDLEEHTDLEDSSATFGGAGVPESTNTIVEGVPAVSSSSTRLRGPRETIDESVDSSSDISRSFAVVSEPESTATPSLMPRLAAFGIVWALITAAGVGAVLYDSNQSGDGSGEAKEVALVTHEKLSVGSGSFKKGLDERTRAFILRTCLKLADSSDQCEQDTLLAGEFPEEDATLDAYAIDNTEVTVGRYQSCVDEGACEEPDYKRCKVYTHQGLQISLRVPKAMREPEVPQVCVTRAQSQAYCAHAGGALPTPDQWERAARGDDGRLFPWGPSWDSVLANWAEQDLVRTSVLGRIDGFSYTAPPGQFEDGKSPAGAYDMAGNVAEWVAGEGEDGVARGGSWVSDPFDMRTTGRKTIPADTGRTDVGFRCAYASGS